jgi:hypothetical protein
MTILLYVTDRARALKTLAVNVTFNTLSRNSSRTSIRKSSQETIRMAVYIGAGTLFAALWAVYAGISVDFGVVIILNSIVFYIQHTSGTECGCFTTHNLCLKSCEICCPLTCSIFVASPT